MTQRLVLVVDDLEDNRIIFSAILAHYGYAVMCATDGEAGVELAKRYVPDLVLMDLQMPGVDGWEAIRRLKAEPGTASIPVLAVTAGSVDPDRLREAGFCASLRKPVSPRRVVEAVELCLSNLALGKPWTDIGAAGVDPGGPD